MSAYQAGKPRVSSTVTKTNPRPRKYATASERQAAYRARAPEVCFRAEAKTVETLDRIAETIDQSRADVLLSMTKFALANHDWARFGLTHRPLPFGYGLEDQPATNPAPIWKRKRPKSLDKPVPLTPKQKKAAKARAAAAGRKYPNLVDNIAASRMENPSMKKPTPAQLAARAKFAEMARSGAFKRKANPAKKTVSQKISQLVREGYPQKQAVAVALSEERAGKVKRNPAPKLSVGDEVKFAPAVVKRVGGDARTKNMRGVIMEIVSGGKVALVDTRGTLVSEEGNSVRAIPTANLVLDVKRNPATGRKGSGTKLNPAVKVPRYTVQILTSGKANWKRIAMFYSLEQAKAYAEAIPRAYKVVAVRVVDDK